MATKDVCPRCELVSTQRFEDYVRAHTREHELAQEVLKEAKAAVDTRLEGMNELRAQINSERGSYETKDSAEVFRLRMDERFLLYQERINSISQEMISIKSRLEGSRSTTLLWIAGIGVFFTLVQIVLKFGLPGQ